MIEQIKDASNQEVFFPISIDSGESVSLTFELNTLIPASVNMLLLDQYGTEAQISGAVRLGAGFSQTDQG